MSLVLGKRPAPQLRLFCAPTHVLSTPGTSVLCSITPCRFSFPQTLVPICNSQSCVYFLAYWSASFNRVRPVLSRGHLSCSSDVYVQPSGEWLLWDRGPAGGVLSATSRNVNVVTTVVCVKEVHAVRPILKIILEDSPEGESYILCMIPMCILVSKILCWRNCSYSRGSFHLSWQSVSLLREGKTTISTSLMALALNVGSFGLSELQREKERGKKFPEAARRWREGSRDREGRAKAKRGGTESVHNEIPLCRGL